MESAVQAVEALISEYYKLVFHTIYGLTGDWDESQDLTQETFHKALKSIDAARKSSGTAFRPRAWLLSIAVNTVREQRRRRKIFSFIPFSRMGKGQTEEREEASTTATLQQQAAPVQPAGYGTTEHADPAILIAEQDAVQRTMVRLSEPLRECLLLSIIGDFSTAEIARMLDLQEAAVRQRLARARKQFQELYAVESNEHLSDQPARQAEKTDKRTRKAQHHEGGVESHVTRDMPFTTTSPSETWRSYAERLYREPAVTPLW